MIACEKTGRHARLMEIDPRYVDVIVKRRQDFTGKQATLAGSNETFEQVQPERRPESRDTLDEEAPAARP